MIGQTIADLGDAIVREMEEVERIASTSRNLKGIFVRRLRDLRRELRLPPLRRNALVPVHGPRRGGTPRGRQRIVGRRGGIYHRSKREKTKKGGQVGDERLSFNSRIRKNIRRKGTVMREGGFSWWSGSELT
jgi:hypothetical protein